MIELWLRSGTAGIVTLPFVTLYLIAVGIVWLTHLSPARAFFASCVGIAGPFFASVAVLFGLFAAFLANDVQHANDRAQEAVMREADGIRTTLRLAEVLGEPAKDVVTAATSYARSVMEKDWPAMRRGKMEDDLGAFRNLALAVLSPALTATTPQAAQQAMLDALVEIRQARMQRIGLVQRESHPVNWLGVLVLGILTQVAIAVVQLDKLRPQALALFVFTTAFAATVALIGVNERPFAGREIDDAPFRAAMATSMP